MQPDKPYRPKGPIIIWGIFLIIFGSVTTIGLQYGREIKVRGAGGPDGLGDVDGHPKAHHFKHDFFMAPMLCAAQVFGLILYCIINATSYGAWCFPREAPEPGPGRQRNLRAERDMQYNKALFIPPAIFNYAGTCLLYVGYNLTFSSSTILFRGTLLFFTSLLSVAFLGRNMNVRMWTGVVIGIIGLAVLGINDYIFQRAEEYDTNGIVAGDLLIVMAQIMYASQAVYEQKILSRYTNLSPLETLGYEGCWGFCISFILVIPFAFVNAGAFSDLPGHYLEHPTDAFKQMSNSWIISLIVIGAMLFNSLHYLLALSITKAYGATPRIVIDSIGFAIVWGIFLALKWEKYDLYIIPGFFLVVLGFMVYFDLLFYPIFRVIRRRMCYEKVDEEEDHQNLLVNDDGNDIMVNNINPGVQH